MKAEKKLNPNVDFYSASTYYALRIPIDSFTPLFAVSHLGLDCARARTIQQPAHQAEGRLHGPEYPQRHVSLSTADRTGARRHATCNMASSVAGRST